MKVYPVSLQIFNSHPKSDKYDLKYLYTMSEHKNKDYTKRYIALTVLAAVSAVCITLLNVSGRKRIH